MLDAHRLGGSAPEDARGIAVDLDELRAEIRLGGDFVVAAPATLESGQRSDQS